MSMSMSLLSQKALIFGATTYGISKFGFKETNETKNLLEAVAGASAVFVADSLANYIPTMGLEEGSVVSQRIVEMGLISGFAFAIEKYGIGVNNNNSMIETIGKFVVADLVSTYAVDYLNGRPLSFL